MSTVGLLLLIWSVAINKTKPKLQQIVGGLIVLTGVVSMYMTLMSSSSLSGSESLSIDYNPALRITGHNMISALFLSAVIVFLKI